MMPSIRDLAKVSLGLASWSSSTPESVSITSPATGEQLVAYFGGWTSSFNVLDYCSKKEALDVDAVTPLTVFSSTHGDITCDWVKEQVETYESEDDVFEQMFLKCKNVCTPSEEYWL